MKASKIAKFLSLKLHGPDCEVTIPVPLDDLKPDVVAFSKESGRILFSRSSYVESPDPKKDFFLVVREFFPDLRRSITIGSHCIIQQSVSIGGIGFSINLDKEGNPYNAPHIGGVRIGHHVDIGHFSIVTRGILGDTIIGDYTKLDDFVHIAHNCIIEKNCKMASGTIVGGSAVVRNGSFLGTNVTVKNHVSIGPNNLVGVGSVVAKDIVGENEVWAGNPARFLRMKKEGDL